MFGFRSHNRVQSSLQHKVRSRSAFFTNKLGEFLALIASFFFLFIWRHLKHCTYTAATCMHAQIHLSLMRMCRLLKNLLGAQTGFDMEYTVVLLYCACSLCVLSQCFHFLLMMMTIPLISFPLAGITLFTFKNIYFFVVTALSAFCDITFFLFNNTRCSVQSPNTQCWWSQRFLFEMSI